jgi:hypothetical protein
LLIEKNSQVVIRSQDTSQVTRLQAELKTQNYTINDLKYDIAFYITQLDLAQAGFRVFDCRHENLGDIPDRFNTTRQKTAGFVADQFFKDWMSDATFSKSYDDARASVINHHQAHEKVQQGKGVASWRIRKEFEALDQKRGVATKY